MTMPNEDETAGLLADQIAYYRARAPEYDDWWARRGPEWDMGPELNDSVRANQAELFASLATADPRGHVLELAAGTGTFTSQILRHADHVTAVDASPETLELNRGKNGVQRVDYLVADLFAWEPPQRYDAVCFSFWISHIPAARWREFWDLVDRALVPDGTVWFCDNAHPEHVDVSAPPEVWSHGDRRRGDAETPGGERRPRQLRDGRRFDVVKRYWHPTALETDLGAVGWDAHVGTTAWMFLHGTATRARPQGKA